MTSNISSSTTGHAYRLRPMPTNSLNSSNSNSTGPSSNTNASNNSNSSYYGSSSSAAPIVAAPTWSYSSPSQLARKYANVTPIWCHITKPRQLKKKFASTFHQAQSMVNFYNEDRAPSERRGSLNQTPQQQSQQQNQQTQSQQQQQQSQPVVHTTNANPHHYHHYESNSYRQPYSSHYIPYDHGIEPSSPAVSSSSSRAKKKYTGGALTMHISSARLQSPPPPPPSISSVAMEEKFSNPSERKARIDQLKDLVFNTRVKDAMTARSDSRNRSTTNLHKANSYKRIDQITNPMDDYQPSVIPPTTPARKDSHYYHYHLPSSTIASIVNENLNRPIVPPPPPVPTATSTSNATVSQPTYNYDYLRAKSKEHTRPTYYESNYITNPIRPAEIPPPPPSTSQIGSNSSSYVGPTTTTTGTSTNPSSSYRSFDDHGYIGKPNSIVDKNSSYTSITSYPSYQTPGSSKRRIKKYLLAKGSTGAGLSHQTEPIIANLENLSLHDDEKIINGDDSSSVVIANTHAMTPPSPLRTSPSTFKPTMTTTTTTTTTTNATVVPSLDSTPPIPVIPALSPSSSPVRVAIPPSVSVNNTAVESAVFSTPNAPLSPSPPPNHSNNKIPPVIVVPLSASLTSLNNQPAAMRSTTNSLLELVPLHRDKEQSPSRSIVPAAPEDGSSTPPRNNLQTSSSIERHRRRRHNRHDSSENRRGGNGAGGNTRAESITSTSSASKRHKKTNNVTNNHTNNTYHHHHHHKRSSSSSNQKSGHLVDLINNFRAGKLTTTTTTTTTFV